MPHYPRVPFRRSLLFVAISATTSLSNAQEPQTRDPSTRKPEQSQATLEEVLVTGTRFQNSLINRLPVTVQELPFAFQSLSEDLIEERGFFNPKDIVQTVPNASVRNQQFFPGGDSYQIRGFFATLLVNNRPQSDARGAGGRDISFIDRIEVLKGPTSITLGPVLPGGVINQVTKTPGAEDFIDVTLRGGTFDTFRTEIDANGAQLFGSDRLAGRVTVAYETLGSVQDPVTTDTIAIRPVVEWDVSDRTRVMGSVSYIERDSVTPSNFPVFEDGSVPDVFRPDTFVGVPADTLGEDIFVDAEVQHEFLDNLKLVVRGSYQDASVDYQNSQGAYNYTGDRGFSEGDTIGFTYFSRGFRSQEILFGDAQLVGNFSAFGQQQDWVVGASYREDDFLSTFGFDGILGQIDILDFRPRAFDEPTYTVPLTPFFDRVEKVHSTYGELAFRPIERLTILGGLRYDTVEGTDFDVRVGSQTQDFDDVTARIGASYALLPTVNAYVSYAESFIPQNGATRAGDTIEPETAVNYEGGIKVSALENRVSLTATAFLLIRQNVSTPDPNNLPGEPQFQVATGEQEHRGVELTASANLGLDIRLDAAYGHVDTEITESNSLALGTAVGDPADLTPSNTYSFFLTYAPSSGIMQGFSLGGGVRGISSRPAPRFGLSYPGYDLVDINASYTFLSGTVLRLNVLNALDEEYRSGVGFSTGSPGGGHRFGNTRAAYLTIQHRF